MRCTIPPEVVGRMIHISAAEARYVPFVPNMKRTGGWELTGAQTLPEEIDIPENKILEVIDKGKFFLKVSRVDFDAMTRHNTSYILASTWQLYQELQNTDPGRSGAPVQDRKKAVLFHPRLVRPILSIVLVILGLAVILGDQNR